MPRNQTPVCIIRLMKTWLLVITILLILAISGCGQPAGSDVVDLKAVGSDAGRYNPELDKNCKACDLSGTNLSGADPVSYTHLTLPTILLV